MQKGELLVNFPWDSEGRVFVMTPSAKNTEAGNRYSITLEQDQPKVVHNVSLLTWTETSSADASL